MEVLSQAEIYKICKASARRRNEGAEASRRRSDMAKSIHRHTISIYKSLFGGESKRESNS
tara:strand:- start:5749 stop:5928 length:180 start_codon:yes stop_codon:yes gene_type:complete